jgi:hypothetical protein
MNHVNKFPHTHLFKILKAFNVSVASTLRSSPSHFFNQKARPTDPSLISDVQNKRCHIVNGHILRGTFIRLHPLTAR